MGRSFLIKKGKIAIIHEDCDPQLAEDKGLPTSAFLVTYKLDGRVCYDIAMANKQVDLFDHYWDHYRYDFMTFKQTEGTRNPKTWDYVAPDNKKKKER
jgi:hypothetical protein